MRLVFTAGTGEVRGHPVAVGAAVPVHLACAFRDAAAKCLVAEEALECEHSASPVGLPRFAERPVRVKWEPAPPRIYWRQEDAGANRVLAGHPLRAGVDDEAEEL